MFKLTVVLALASGSILVAQQNRGSADRAIAAPAVSQPAQPAEKKIVGNEKTLGVNSTPFRTAEDRPLIGNAKTVGGDQNDTVAIDRDGIGKVGNAKTVGNN